VSAGPLILAGGAEFDERMVEADRAWLAGWRIGEPRVGVFPTASDERPELAAANGVTHFQRLAANASAVMVTDRLSTDDEYALGQVAELDFAYFAGGNPLQLSRTLAGSAVWQALLERWRAGMGLGGSSAGAMVMCEALFLPATGSGERWADGLGIVAGTVAVPHLNRRDEAAIERARQAVAGRGYLGIGIDESTALIWTAAGGWRVAGPGRVCLLGREGVAPYRQGETPPGLPAPGP